MTTAATLKIQAQRSANLAAQAAGYSSASAQTRAQLWESYVADYNAILAAQLPGVPKGYPAKSDGSEPLDAYLTKREAFKQYGGGLATTSEVHAPQNQKIISGSGYSTPTQVSYGTWIDAQNIGQSNYSTVYDSSATYRDTSKGSTSASFGPYPAVFDEFGWLNYRISIVGKAGLTARETEFKTAHDKRPSTLQQGLEIAKGIAIVVGAAAAGVAVGAAVGAAGGASAAGAGGTAAATGGAGGGGLAGGASVAATAGATAAGGGTIVAGTAIPAAATAATAGGIGAGTLGTATTAISGAAVAAGKAIITKKVTSAIDGVINPLPKSPAGQLGIGVAQTETTTVAAGTTISIPTDMKSVAIYVLFALLALFVIAGKRND